MKNFSPYECLFYYIDLYIYLIIFFLSLCLSIYVCLSVYRFFLSFIVTLFFPKISRSFFRAILHSFFLEFFCKTYWCEISRKKQKCSHFPRANEMWYFRQKLQTVHEKIFFLRWKTTKLICRMETNNFMAHVRLSFPRSVELDEAI